MDDTRYICTTITDRLGEGSPVVLATIVSMEGSTPRESGSRMVIASGGTTFGTVGGGIMEAMTIEESKKVLETGVSKFIEIDMTSSDTSSSDMICGGSTVLLLDFLKPTSENLDIYSKMGKLMDDGESYYCVTAYLRNGENIDIKGHCGLFSNGETFGDAIITGNAMPAIREELHNISKTMTLTIGDTEYIIEPIRRIKTVYCFGGGHVAVPTAHIASLCGFNVVVVDDREEFANRERFPEADKAVVIDDYTKALEGFEIDRDSFIVILTRGHRFDREVLEQAIQTDAGYIGMISSKRKRDSVYERLIGDGVTTAEALKRVHSPIGLSIGAQTPEEIAVSIVGEMITVRGTKQ